MQWISKLALALVLLCLGSEARAGLAGDVVSVEQHGPILGNVFLSQDVVVEAGSGDAVVFGVQNATTIDVDPDAIILTLGCDFAVCNRISSSAAFNGFVLTGLDWSMPPGPPVELRVASEGKFFDAARVVLLPGRIEINLLFDVFRDGDTVALLPVYSPQVAIDVVPRDADNVVRSGRGRIPVALLGSEELDVRGVDPFSLRLGPGEAPASWRFLWLLLWRFMESDVNRDGYSDLVFSFGARAASIPPDAGEVCVSGEFEGLPFTSCDAIEVRPPAR